MTKRGFSVVLTLLLAGTVMGGEAGRTVSAGRDGASLTGNIRVDLFGVHTMNGMAQVIPSEGGTMPSEKSPWLAAGLSLALPGAGEFYAESYWKAAAFLAVEVAVWSIAYSYDRKGNNQTDFYQGYANEHWSVTRYAQWTIDNAAAINPAVNPSQYGVFDPSGNVVWSELNRLERALGGWYSHTLPVYGEQQYYELIGKYQQYFHGWREADDPALRTLVTYEDISAYLSSHPNSQFQYYSRERGKANDYYSTASTAVTIAIVNHLLSAADAAWSASSYNKVQVRMGTQTLPTPTELVRVPVIKVSYGF